MAATLAENIAILENTQSALVELVSGLDNATLDLHSAPEEWSIREILAHLVDDEMYVMRLRLERIVKEDNPQLIPHDEKRWYANRNTNRDKLSELLADFALQRNASLGIITMLRPEDWARTGFQPEYGQFTAEKWLSNWVNHDTTHLEQIKANLALYNKTT